MTRQIITSADAPQAIGCYSQAVAVNGVVYFSGQIGLNPQTMTLVDGFESQTHQVFKNLAIVANAAGGDLSKIVKINIYLTDMNNFAIVNKIMAQYFSEPYPARAAIGVKELPKGAVVEADGIMVLG